MSEFLPLSSPHRSDSRGSTVDSPTGYSAEQFLQLRLAATTRVLLPIQQLIEVLTVSEGQIIPIPHMPAWVIGVYNWRGEILWMIDLGHLCGLAPWYQQSVSRSMHSAVVLNITEHSTTAPARSNILGLVVSQVEDIEWCQLDAIQALSQTPISPELAQLAAGYWQRTENDSLVILDGKAILDQMPQ
ncbi:MAG: chemotaxis protein CheW [Elainella sp. C42_A2020_010]|nr:chemotaxis protein CheW [Elainella sp. C42_A2020_010]RNJ68726.1 MAG: chemotaxis protein CheW [Leptolyngbya sp. IPPAS B-1204]